MGEFPLIEVPGLGGGMVIAVIALFHVVLAHYAVGAGILLHGLEKSDPSGKAGGIQRLLDIVGISIIYVSFVIGAISGVGIWFAISLFSPDATLLLIQKFVWWWATEWTFFAVEIVVGYLYYYRRRVLSHAARLRLAQIYMLAAWGSLLVITGILSYMLTSRSGNAIVAWANASVWPSVALRTISAITLAALLLLLVTTIRPLFPFAHDSEERRATCAVIYRYLWCFFLLLPCALWYRLSLPSHHAAYAEGSSIPMSMFLGLTGFFSVLVTGIALFAYLKRRVLQFEGAALLLVLGVVATFSAEFVREGIRKPYIIYPIMYSNAMLASDVEEWQAQADAKGSLLKVRELYPDTPQARAVGDWFLPHGQTYDTLDNVARGKQLYRAQCMICHTPDGFNALKHLVRAWDDEDYARAELRTMHISRPYMPPFVGSEADADQLVQYLQTLIDRQELAEIEGKTDDQ